MNRPTEVSEDIAAHAMANLCMDPSVRSEKVVMTSILMSYLNRSL